MNIFLLKNSAVYAKFILIIIAIIALQYTSFCQKNPNDLPIEKRIAALTIYSLNNYDVEPLYMESIYNGKTVSSIKYTRVETFNYPEDHYQMKLKYDSKCRVSKLELFSYDTLANTVLFIYNPGEIITEFTKDFKGNPFRRVFKYDLNENITKIEFQFKNGLGDWEIDPDNYSIYSMYDNCGNAHLIDNSSFTAPYSVDIKYLGSTCLPEITEFTIQNVNYSLNYKDTFSYDANYNLLVDKTVSHFSTGGTLCHLYTYSYNPKGLIKTYTPTTCYGSQSALNFNYFWNADSSIHKLEGFDLSESADVFSIIEFEYQACTPVYTHESLDTKFRLSPNPASNTLYLNIDELDLTSSSRITINNPFGQTLLSKPLLDKDMSIDISELKSGMYYLILETTKGSITKSFIKI